MDDNIDKKTSFSGQENPSVDEFLKSLNFSFKQASMYFAEHPAFVKSVSMLAERLRVLSAYRKNIHIDVSPENLVIDGKVFDPRSVTGRELAEYLHRRRIKSVEFSAKVKSEDLSRFIEQTARSLEGLKQDKSVREIVSNVEGARIEEIDYSDLLSEGGKYSKEIWEFLLSKEKRKKGGRDKIEYIARNIQEVLGEAVRAGIGREGFRNLFSGVEEVGEGLKDKPEVKTFANRLAEAVAGLPEDAAEVLAGQESFTRLKNLLSSRVEPEFLEKKILEKITETRKYNSSMLSFYNLITGKKLGEEEFAGRINAAFGRENDVEKKERMAESIKEVFFSDKSDEFVSCLYKKTLTFLPDHKELGISQTQDYREMSSPDVLEESYFYSLLSLFSVEETKEGIELLLDAIGEEISVFSKKDDLKAEADFVSLLERRKDFLEKNFSRELLSGIYKKVSSQEMVDRVKKKMFSERIETIACFARWDERILDYILRGFLTIRDVTRHKRLREILTAVSGDKLVRKIKNLFGAPQSAFIAGEVLTLLEKRLTRATAELLETIYRHYPGNILIQKRVIGLLKNNPYRDKDFIFSFCREKIFELRKPAALSFLDEADSEQAKSFLDILFHRRNFLGLNDRFFIENIEIVRESRSKEAVPYLIDIISRRPWFFQKRRDVLRIKSFAALTAIDLEKAKDLFSVFIDRSCPAVKKQEKMFREKWKI